MSAPNPSEAAIAAAEKLWTEGRLATLSTWTDGLGNLAFPRHVLLAEAAETIQPHIDAACAELVAKNERLKESPLTFHRCPDGKIRQYAAVFCSSHRNVSDGEDFNPLNRLRELEAEVSALKQRAEQAEKEIRLLKAETNGLAEGAGRVRARAEKAEARIAAVRELCDQAGKRVNVEDLYDVIGRDEG